MGLPWGCKIKPGEGFRYVAVVAASADYDFMLLRDDGAVFLYDWWEMWDAPTERLILPTAVDGAKYVGISASETHFVLLCGTGTATLVPGSVSHKLPPLEPGFEYRQVVAGEGFTLLLRSDGRLFGCGVRGSQGPDLILPEEDDRYVEISEHHGVIALVRFDRTVLVSAHHGDWRSLALSDAQHFLAHLSENTLTWLSESGFVLEEPTRPFAQPDAKLLRVYRNAWTETFWYSDGTAARTSSCLVRDLLALEQGVRYQLPPSVQVELWPHGLCTVQLFCSIHDRIYVEAKNLSAVTLAEFALPVDALMKDLRVSLTHALGVPCHMLAAVLNTGTYMLPLGLDNMPLLDHLGISQEQIAASRDRVKERCWEGYLLRNRSFYSNHKKCSLVCWGAFVIVWGVLF